MKIPVRFPLKPGKTYYTRDEREVRVYATDGCGKFPIHGAFRKGKDIGWEMDIWSETGRAVPEYLDDLDIVYEEWVPQDKALVWCWDNHSNFEKTLRFYDAINKKTFRGSNGTRNGCKYDNYAPYIGEPPEWAKEALRELKD